MATTPNESPKDADAKEEVRASGADARVVRTPNILSYELRCADDPEGNVHDIMPADELAKRMPEFAALLTDSEFHSLSYCVDLQSVEVSVFEYGGRGGNDAGEAPD